MEGTVGGLRGAPAGGGGEGGTAAAARTRRGVLDGGRRLSLGLSLATLVGPGGAVLAACGGRGAEGQPGAAPGARRPATVVVHSRAGTAGHFVFQQGRIPLFKEQFPHLDVQYDGIPEAELRTKLLVLAAGGSIGDLAWNGTFAGSHELLAKGTFQPVEQYIKADKFDVRPYLPASLDAQRHNGQVHGLPFIGHFGSNAVYLHKDLFQRAGVDLPPADANWTVDGLVERSRRFVSAGLLGFSPATGVAEAGTAWLRTFGGDLLSADGKRCLIDAPEGVAALTWMAETVHKHQLAGSFTGQRALFEDSKMAMFQGTLGAVAEFQAPGAKAKAFAWDVTVIPRGPGGKRGTQGSGTGYAVTKQAKAPEGAWEWTKFITNKENGIEQTFGGGGSPGGRTDVWNDPRLHSLSPIYGLMVRTFGQPGPFHAPHNTRTDQINKAVDDALKPLWDGQIAPRDAARTAREAVDQVLSQPM